MKVPWNRGGLRTHLVLLALVFARPAETALWWGVSLLVLGVALHVYAKGCLRQNEVVATGGPYRFVRHPFYSANLLVDEGIAVLSGWWPLILLLPVWWLLVYWPVMRQEERHLCELFPDVYPEYQRRTSRLIPSRRPLPVGGAGFSWRNRNIAADTVIPRAAKLLSLPLLFLIWHGVRLHGAGFFAEGAALRLFAVSLLVSIYGLSGMWTRHFRDRKLILPSALRASELRLVVALALLLLAGSLHQFETESDVVLPLVGALGLALSLALYVMRRRARLAAEGLALAALLVLCELPWLMLIPTLLYTALLLDERLWGVSSKPRVRDLAPRSWLAQAGAYHSIVVLGLFAAALKELL